MSYIYHPDVLEQLARHGVQPSPHTPPRRAHEVVSDLYRYELRQLRGQLLRGLVPKRDYSAKVIALRKRYWILTVPVRLWAQEKT